MQPDIRDPETYAIIGAAMEVHRILGCGFLESVYHEALRSSCHDVTLPFGGKPPLPVMYKGTTLACGFRVDFICGDSVLIEIKALVAVGSLEDSQVINYLKASGLRKALLINFSAESLQSKRLVL